MLPIIIALGIVLTAATVAYVGEARLSKA